MILLDGKKLAQKILDGLKNEVAGFSQKLRLAVAVVGNDPVTKKFIEQKKKTAGEIGIDVRIFPFEENVTTNELRKRIAEIVHEKKNTGVIVQLPLPAHINIQYILNSVTPEKDADMLSSRSLGNFVVGKTVISPPLVEAAKTFFSEYEIDYHQKYIVVVGAGKLVGKPMALWLLNEDVTFSVLRSSTPDISKFTKEADIIITGVGMPALIRGDMVKQGVVIIDAGTSESGGKLVGDVDFESVFSKVSFITPVPGGMGPLGVAMLFKNLVALARK